MKAKMKRMLATRMENLFEQYTRRNDSNWIPTDFLGKRDRWKYWHHNTQDLSCYIQSHTEAFQDNTWHGRFEDGRHNLIKGKISLGIFPFAKYKWQCVFCIVSNNKSLLYIFTILTLSWQSCEKKTFDIDYWFGTTTHIF